MEHPEENEVCKNAFKKGGILIRFVGGNQESIGAGNVFTGAII